MAWKYLQYDGETGKKRTVNGGSGGASELNDLEDVNVSSPSDGQVLKYDANAGKWVNANESGGGGNVSDVTVGGVSVVNQQGVAEIPAIPDGLHHYSTTEHIIGTWIDGKPIYEKTVHFTKTDCTKENDYDYRLDFNRTALGIKNVIDIKGILKMSITNWGTIEIKFNGRAYCLNDSTKDRWIDWTNYYQSSAIKSQKASEGYGFNLNSETSNWDGYYTIQYTKTTD